MPIILTLALLLLTVIPAMADQFSLTPSIAVKEEYDDNLFFDVNKDTAKQDVITTLSPGLALVNNTERMKARLSGRLDQSVYAKNNDFNALDQLYDGAVQYFMSPQMTLGATASYTQDSRPDRDIATTGLVLNAMQRNQQRYGLSGDYTFTEKTYSSFNVEYSLDQYDSPKFSDLEVEKAWLLVLHDFSSLLPATKGRGSISYARYSLVDTGIENYGASVGINKSLSEIWSFLLEFGARYTRSSFTGALLSSESEATGVIGQAVMSYGGEKTQVDFTFKRDLTPASQWSGTAERTDLTFRINQRLSYEWWFTLSGGYYINKADKGELSTQVIDQQTMFIIPGIRYEFSKDLNLDASYNYTTTKYNVTDTSADRSLFMVRLSLKHPFFE